MGHVVAFSELEDYLSKLDQGASHFRGTILDTNILISATYEIKADHETVTEALSLVQDHGYRFFTTVNTRSEFLEFHRRLILTENLLDSIESGSPLNLSNRARAQIQTAKGQLAAAQSRGSDPVFNDRQLKDIKKAFSAGPHSGAKGWLLLCELFLKDRLSAVDAEIISRGVEYISQHDSAQANIFRHPIGWPDAVHLAEETGLGFSDAMILNALHSSECPFIISADFDCGYAILADPSDKVAVIPDSIVRDYRSAHFPDPGERP